MTEKQVYQEADKLSDYILKMMERTEAGVPECLTIMSAAVDQVIRSLCKVIEEDPEQMITVFCNALQQGLEKERHYSTGSKEGDDFRHTDSEEPVSEDMEDYHNMAKIGIVVGLLGIPVASMTNRFGFGQIPQLLGGIMVIGGALMAINHIMFDDK